MSSAAAVEAFHPPDDFGAQAAARWLKTESLRSFPETRTYLWLAPNGTLDACYTLAAGTIMLQGESSLKQCPSVNTDWISLAEGVPNDALEDIAMQAWSVPWSGLTKMAGSHGLFVKR
jgi:hypothetical protein